MIPYPASPGDPFLLGINYWPRKKAMFMWEQFDPSEIQEELSLIRSLGLTHVRIFLLWESFQPTPTAVSTTALANLRTLADIAHSLSLRLQPTFFTGHMSGPNWAPDWLLSHTPRQPNDRWLVSTKRFTPSPTPIHNIYTDPFVLDAEKLQLTTIAHALKDHPALWAWSLGNEPDLFCRPPADQIGRAWIRTMADTLRAADPRHPVTIGFHTSSIDSNVNLRADHAAESTDFSVMHGYSIYHPVARGPLDPDWLPFTAALTHALAGRPVLYEEFGLCTRPPGIPSGYDDIPLPWGSRHRQFFASEHDAATWFAQVLPRLHQVGCLGAFAWCFADYDPALWNKPPCDIVRHERSFGLFRADGTPKPAARALQAFAATNPRIQPPARTLALPSTPDAYYQNAWPLIQKLYDAFGTM